MLLVLGMMMQECDGWIWRRHRRVVIHHHHHSSNCHCSRHYRELLHLLPKLGKKHLGRRDVSTIFDVDEGDPLLAEVMQKRGGMVAKEELYDAAKRAYTHLPTGVKRWNHCHCRREVLQHLGRSLD